MNFIVGQRVIYNNQRWTRDEPWIMEDLFRAHAGMVGLIDRFESRHLVYIKFEGQTLACGCTDTQNLIPLYELGWRVRVAGYAGRVVGRDSGGDRVAIFIYGEPQHEWVDRSMVELLGA